MNAAPPAQGPDEIILTVENLGYTYHEGSIATEVFTDLSFTVRRGVLTGIVGQSGSGKSTLLHLLGTLDHPAKGSIRFGDRELTTMSAAEAAAFRNTHLGFVYQFHHLLADFSALENVAMPLLIGGQPRAEAYAAAEELLSRVGLGDKAAHRPAELSGGERQRVAIARALSPRPELILADEPTGNLDRHNAEAVFALFQEVTAERGCTVIMVTHDRALSARCGQILTLCDGHMVSEPRP